MHQTRHASNNEPDREQRTHHGHKGVMARSLSRVTISELLAWWKLV